jgi:hypothetical protein
MSVPPRQYFALPVDCWSTVCSDCLDDYAFLLAYPSEGLAQIICPFVLNTCLLSCLSPCHIMFREAVSWDLSHCNSVPGKKEITTRPLTRPDQIMRVLALTDWLTDPYCRLQLQPCWLRSNLPIYLHVQCILTLSYTDQYVSRFCCIRYSKLGLHRLRLKRHTYNLAAYRLLKPLSSCSQHLVNIYLHVCRHIFSIRVVQPQYGVPFTSINYALAHSWRAFTRSYTTADYQKWMSSLAATLISTLTACSSES